MIAFPKTDRPEHRSYSGSNTGKQPTEPSVSEHTGVWSIRHRSGDSRQ
jgi:hypothetical protein